MTRSEMARETDERARAMTAEDRVVEYLYQNHHDRAATIAMRVLYRLALTWKIERDCRLLRDRDDPRKTVHIRDEYVHRVHNRVAALPPVSQSDALAEHFILALLAEFEPDRAWFTSHKVYNDLAWPTGHTFHL